jgi:hypothetical protein
MRSHSYAGVDGICNIASSALQILPRKCDQDGRLGILVKPLLHSAIVSALFGSYVLGAVGNVVVVDIAHVPLGYVLG